MPILLKMFEIAFQDFNKILVTFKTTLNLPIITPIYWQTEIYFG